MNFMDSIKIDKTKILKHKAIFMEYNAEKGDYALPQENVEYEFFYDCSFIFDLKKAEGSKDSIICNFQRKNFENCIFFTENDNNALIPVIIDFSFCVLTSCSFIDNKIRPLLDYNYINSSYFHTINLKGRNIIESSSFIDVYNLANKELKSNIFENCKYESLFGDFKNTIFISVISPEPNTMNAKNVMKNHLWLTDKDMSIFESNL